MNKLKNSVPLTIEINDLITPRSCSSFIAEIIKYITYNKQQIPFPFERLKIFVFKRQERQKAIELSGTIQDTNTSGRVSILMEKYYKRIEEAFETLHNTFKCIERELSEQPVEEVVVLFGATPVSPKDVYRFKIPNLSHGHADTQHAPKKQLANLFRNIITSEEVHKNMERRVGLTNMFVMFKIRKDGVSQTSSCLLPKDHYRLSERAQQVCFTFTTSRVKPCTCFVQENSEQIIVDTLSSLVLDDDAMSREKDYVWYQTPKSLKGFKDCKTSGSSVTDLWYRHGFI